MYDKKCKFSLDVMARLQDARRGNLTFAPEAGSQRLRDVINKGLTEEEILAERSGVLSLGAEGLMLVGALAAIGAQLAFGATGVSLVLAMAAASLVSVLFAVGLFCVSVPEASDCLLPMPQAARQSARARIRISAVILFI